MFLTGLDNSKEILSQSNGGGGPGGAGRGEAAFTAAEQEGHTGGPSDVCYSLPTKSREGCANISTITVQQAAEIFWWISHSSCLFRGCKARRALRAPAEHCTSHQEVINTTLKFLLEEPESADQIEAASIEVGRLLRDSAAPCLPQYGPLSAAPLLGVCTIAARFMVRSIFKEFDHHSRTFHIMDYDDSLFSAREDVIFAIQDMDNRMQTAACRPQPELSTSEGSQEGLLEEKETSPEVSLEETTPVRTSMLRLVADVIVHMEPGLHQKDGPLEDREAAPEVLLDEVTATVRTSSSSRLETNVIVYNEPELEVLQEELEAEDFGVPYKESHIIKPEK